MQSRSPHSLLRSVPDAETTPLDTRGAIVEIAMRMFAERGYEGVSVRDITRALQLTPGAIYHHFPSKKDLYDAVVVAAFEQVMEQLVVPANARGRPEYRLRALILRLAEYMGGAPVGMQLVDRVIFEATGPLTERVTTVVDRTHAALASLIAELNPAAPAPAYAEHILAAVYGAQKLRPIRARLTIATGISSPAGLADSLTAFTLAALGTPQPPRRKRPV